jgi:hypothetical protein
VVERGCSGRREVCSWRRHVNVDRVHVRLSGAWARARAWVYGRHWLALGRGLGLALILRNRVLDLALVPALDLLMR